MITGLNHITLAVSNVERSLDFYTRVLGFEGEVIWEKGAYLSIGELWLCLSLDSPCPKTDYSHIAFNIAEEDFATLCEHLKEHNVEQWKSNQSEGSSVYILDPDGHKLEVHCGSLASRLKSLKSKPYHGLKWLKP
ncbi:MULTISPECIES: fosfomycin resistance glutathione transferase [Vibrio]|uniref:fosfomycin resistance glutathione transferase n=1 Tax=Vibrio TaxID=662 RepID=UPI002075652B|nr:MULTISPECIES: fosfomycin resistance glutathione transferase [Vibrio]USD34873.1 fosfomycin resistance glutathione transferase [Vibrio sp. SCSIO 43186]USD47938.1 fosfomycin resistance glutathione transferase [Vibrio sp. SCSIO 43145]USD71997.1 fosfomycin resistance glutathione transferase [Vibrio sp. SCSIO 43139]USD97664.1 glutathione transferase [Vibrio coralliilyticus]